MEAKTKFNYGIKNFFVKVKGVKFREKGLRNLLNYLTDTKRHPDGIINIKRFRKNDFFTKTIENIIKLQLQKKAGRQATNYADSYIFSFPKGLTINKDKYKKIITNLLKKLHKKFNEQLKEEGKEIDFNTFLNSIFVNIHTNKHVHINIIFPRVFELKNAKGETILYSNRITNRKKFLNASKKAFNELVFEEFKLTTTNYKRQTKFKKGYKNIYFKKYIEEIEEEKKKIEEVAKEIEKEKEETIKLANLIEMRRGEIKELAKKIEEENAKAEEIAKAFHLIIRYYKKLKKQEVNKEIKGIIKTYKLIKEKAQILEELNARRELLEIANEIKEEVNKTKKKYKLKI